MRFIAGAFLLTTTLTISRLGVASEEVSFSVCVLNFERELHPFSNALHSATDGLSFVHYIDEAKPADLVKCLTGNYEDAKKFRPNC